MRLVYCAFSGHHLLSTSLPILVVFALANKLLLGGAIKESKPFDFVGSIVAIRASTGKRDEGRRRRRREGRCLRTTSDGRRRGRATLSKLNV